VNTGSESGVRQGVEAVAAQLAPAAGGRNQEHGHRAVAHH
jgi:hypothetical protein